MGISDGYYGDSSEKSTLENIKEWFTNDPSAIAGSYGFLNDPDVSAEVRQKFYTDNWKELMFGDYGNEKKDEARRTLFRQGILKSDPNYDLLLQMQMEYWKEYDKPTLGKALVLGAGIALGEAVRFIVVSRFANKLISRGAGAAVESADIIIRKAYVNEIRGLQKLEQSLSAEGNSLEDIARAMHQNRREIGIKYKNMTSPEMLEQIYQRNLKKYGDKLGPTIEYLRNKGASWEDIIASAKRTSPEFNKSAGIQ